VCAGTSSSSWSGVACCVGSAYEDVGDGVMRGKAAVNPDTRGTFEFTTLRRAKAGVGDDTANGASRCALSGEGPIE
jgi:hypothetical protein